MDFITTVIFSVRLWYTLFFSIGLVIVTGLVIIAGNDAGNFLHSCIQTLQTDKRRYVGGHIYFHIIHSFVKSHTGLTLGQSLSNTSSPAAAAAPKRAIGPLLSSSPVFPVGDAPD